MQRPIGFQKYKLAPIEVVTKSDLQIIFLTQYPGSNGSVFRKFELDLAHAGEDCSDTHTSVSLIQTTGKREWLRLRGRGVYHYYVSASGFWPSLRDFLKKRQRATCHFFDMQKQHGFSWTERKPRIPG